MEIASGLIESSIKVRVKQDKGKYFTERGIDTDENGESGNCQLEARPDHMRISSQPQPKGKASVRQECRTRVGPFARASVWRPQVMWARRRLK